MHVLPNEDSWLLISAPMISGMLILFGHLMSPDGIVGFSSLSMKYLHWLVKQTHMKYPNPLVACLIETIDKCYDMLWWKEVLFVFNHILSTLEQGPFLNIFPKLNYHLVITSPRPSMCRLILTAAEDFCPRSLDMDKTTEVPKRWAVPGASRRVSVVLKGEIVPSVVVCCDGPISPFVPSVNK